MKSTVLFIFVFIFMTVGCNRTVYVPVESQTEYRDSVVTRDSVITRERIQTRDSTVIKDSTVIVLDDKGNVIRKELYREKERYRELNSDYRLLQAKYDSLLSVKNKTEQIPYPVEKQLSNWQKLKLETGGIALGILTVGCTLGLLYIIRRFWRKK
jgi:hypothetical protein|nr:MAG TPA: Integrin beta-2 [Caudoviricetes sp.]